jgi:lysophospholipase L1-like esterase
MPTLAWACTEVAAWPSKLGHGTRRTFEAKTMGPVDRSGFETTTAQSGPAPDSQNQDGRTLGRRLPLWKRILFIIVANVLALSLLALAGEVACRLFAPQLSYGTLPDWTLKMLQFSDDMYMGWELRPGELDHNSAGFRGRETTRQKPPGVWRIAMIGDSVTYGLGVEADQAFASLLEAELKAANVGPVEVLNFGVPGYNSFQECTLLKNRVLAFDPDLVIMTFSPDDVSTTPVVLNVGSSMCLFRNHFEGIGILNNSVHWTIFRSSHLYRFLYKQAALAFAAPEGGFEVGDSKPEVEWLNVCRAADLCAERGAAFLVVLSPWLLPYVEPAEGTDVRTLDPDPEEFRRFADAFDQVRELAAESHLEYLDLGPLYDQYIGKLKLQPLDYEHLNPLGNRLVAKRLCEKVLSMRTHTTKPTASQQGSTVAPDG